MHIHIKFFFTLLGTIVANRVNQFWVFVNRFFLQEKAKKRKEYLNTNENWLYVKLADSKIETREKKRGETSTKP